MGFSAGWKERTAKGLVGLFFHVAVCTIGTFVIGLAISFVIPRAYLNGASYIELLPFIASSALLAAFAARRWFSRSAPWVGLFGLAPLFVGGQELWRGWSPTWSHQTRGDYVVSQLFCATSSCGDSEGLYMVFFGLPFLCLATYSIASFIILWLTKEKS